MARNAIENPAEQLADRLIKLGDRRVELSTEAETHLSAALKALDEAQHELDLANEARGKLVEQELAAKIEAEELRSKQEIDDEKSLLQSAVADRRIGLYRTKIGDADRFLGDLNKTYEQRWHRVRHVAKVIVEQEQRARTSTVTEVLRLVCPHPTFIQGGLANAPCLKGLAGVLWTMTNVMGPDDRQRGDPSIVIPTARQLLEGTLRI